VDVEFGMIKFQITSQFPESRLDVPLLALANVHSASIHSSSWVAHLVGYSVYLIWVSENIELDGRKRQDGQNFVMGSFVICILRPGVGKDRMGEAYRKHVRKSTKLMVRKKCKKKIETGKC
jgi:hypothetical protein